jgi:predicted nucleic acid-binding protein
MWIAATALVHGMGVVTNNVDEFSRMPNLPVVAY